MKLIIIPLAERTELNMNQRGEVSIEHYIAVKSGKRISSVSIDESVAEKLIKELPELMKKSKEIRESKTPDCERYELRSRYRREC